MIEICSKILNCKKLTNEDLSEITLKELKILSIFLIKKKFLNIQKTVNLIKDSQFTELKNIICNDLIKGKINKTSLLESLYNKILRKCFIHWKQRINDTSSLNQNLKHFKNFYKFLYLDMIKKKKLNLTEKKSFEDFYDCLTEKSQIDRKKRKKKISKMSGRKMKFMNLRIMTEQKIICNMLKNKSNIFKKYLNELVDEIKKEYNFLIEHSPNEDTIQGQKNKFSINPYNQLITSLKIIHNYLEYNFFEINEEVNKIRIANIPFTLEEILFESS